MSTPESAPADDEPANLRRTRRALAALLLATGTLHFAAPGPYEPLIPPFLGDPRRVVYVSGAGELLCGVLLARRRTSRLGGWLTAVLLVAVFPGNVQMLLDAGTERQAAEIDPTVFRTMALVRLPIQAPLILWALRVARGPRRRD